MNDREFQVFLAAVTGYTNQYGLNKREIVTASYCIVQEYRKQRANWNEEDVVYTRNDIEQQLLKGEKYVLFKKKSTNTMRTMRCTLSLNIIPKDQYPKHPEDHGTGDNMRVFDMDKWEWRSFNISTVKSVY